MIHKPEAYAQQWQHEIQAEQVPFDEDPATVCHSRAPDTTYFHAVRDVDGQRDAETKSPGEVEKIIQNDGDCDNHCLRDLRAVDTREDIDAVGAERGEERHVHIVQRT